MEPEHVESEAAATERDRLDSATAGPAAVRGGAARVVGYLLVALIGAVAAALLFRHLGVVTNGHYVVATSLVAVVAAVSDLGLTAFGVREIALRSGPERWRLAQELLGLRIVLTLVGGAVVTAIAAASYSATLGFGVALASVGLLFQVTQDNLSMPLLVDLRLAWVAGLELLRQTLSTLLILLLVLLGAHLVPFLAVSIPAGAIVVACTVRLVRGSRGLMPIFAWRRWLELVVAMLPYAAAVAASALYLRVSVLVVSALCDKFQGGYFSASFRVIEVLSSVPVLLASAAFPIFARAARDDHVRLGYALGRVFEVAVVVGAWVAVSTAVGAPLAISVLGGQEYAPAAGVLAIQGVALGAMFVTAVWANGLLGLGRYRQIMALNFGALLANAVVVSAVVLLGGAARGAAAGSAVVEIGAAIANGVAVARGRDALRPSLRVLPRTAAAAALGLAPLALTGLPVIVRLLISTTLFAATLLCTRALPAELLALLPGSVSRRWTRAG